MKNTGFILKIMYTLSEENSRKGGRRGKRCGCCFYGRNKMEFRYRLSVYQGSSDGRGREISAEHVEFSDLTWQKLHEETEHYFAGQEIIGWFLTQKSLQMEVTEGVQRIHMKLFGGEKALMLMDPVEKEEAFFCYDNGRLLRQSGYYIYYEKIRRCRRICWKRIRN